MPRKIDAICLLLNASSWIKWPQKLFWTIECNLSYNGSKACCTPTTWDKERYIWNCDHILLVSYNYYFSRLLERISSFLANSNSYKITVVQIWHFLPFWLAFSKLLCLLSRVFVKLHFLTLFIKTLLNNCRNDFITRQNKRVQKCALTHSFGVAIHHPRAPVIIITFFAKKSLHKNRHKNQVRNTAWYLCNPRKMSVFGDTKTRPYNTTIRPFLA